MKESNKPALIIIVPCYNEEEVFLHTAKTLSLKIELLISQGLISEKSKLLFIDDGSTDNTWGLIENLHRGNPLFYNGIKLKKNQGQESALLCGLLSVIDYADVTVSIDADLQDDIDAIDKMLECYLSGFEIILGVRTNRDTDRLFNKLSAKIFYGLMGILGAGLVKDHSEFRLMGKNAMKALSEYDGNYIFLRGIIIRLGYKIGIVHYEMKKRMAGKSKYSIRKLIKLAIKGIIFYCLKGKPKSKIANKQSMLNNIGKCLLGMEEIINAQ